MTKEMEEVTEFEGRTAIPPKRDEADGSSSPPTVVAAESTTFVKTEAKPFTVNTEIDVMQWLLFILATITRRWNLDKPRSINFDEMHFGRHASLYLRNTFFFDIHPPLGKLLFAFAAYCGGLDPEYKFDKIGADYPADVPVWHLRFFPAFMSSLTVPVIYEIVVQLNLSRWTAALSAAIFIFDNALVVHSRCTVMEAMIVFFYFLALLSYLKIRALSERGCLGVMMWMWWLLLGLSLGCSFSIKYSGLLGYILILSLYVEHFWNNMLSNMAYNNWYLIKYTIASAVFVICLPVALYLSTFYIHFNMLYKAGPSDDVMTSAFQSSLEGGLASITKGQPLNVAFGSQVTLRRTFGSKPCWLHSHNFTYPLRYPDERGSSYQQQVTCYNFKDANNWWLIKNPEIANVSITDPLVLVKDGDIVELVHGITSRLLNSHDVAAPKSPLMQEVSCFVNYHVNAISSTRWRVVS